MYSLVKISDEIEVSLKLPGKTINIYQRKEKKTLRIITQYSGADHILNGLKFPFNLHAMPVNRVPRTKVLEGAQNT